MIICDIIADEPEEVNSRHIGDINNVGEVRITKLFSANLRVHNFTRET